ncbi:MAG: glycosyltransferase family 4 protein [Candidatus Omnitrophica bacterium]|nr:glycosyltransferase family 4 protein [Candidatus Omnitrophota bacterium]
MKLAMVFTFGVSLDTWHKQGVLSREKLIYEEFIRQGRFKKIYWFTYGVNDKKLKHLVNEGIEIIPLPKLFKSKPGMFIYSFLMPFLRGKYFRQVGIIKTNQMKGGWTAWIASLLYKKKFVLRGGYLWSIFALKKYGGVYPLMVDTVEGLLCKFARAIIVTSRFQRDYIGKKYRLRKNKVFVVTNYVDINMFFPDSGIPKIKDRLVFVGRIHRDKNLKNLILALKGLAWGLDIYGEGKLKNNIKRLAEDNSVDVKFGGVIPNARLPEILNKYIYFVLPSSYEGMPKALLEAMSCGLVVIGTNVGGIKEVIKNGENGWLIPDTTVGKIRETLSFLGRRKDIERNLAVHARRDIEDEFSLVSIAEQEFNILKKA